MTTALPTGTVTFLFTDIEGSTRLLARIGDAAYGDVLATERRLVVGAAEAEGGVAVSSEGDSHFIVFPSASGAIRAAVAAQRALASEPWPNGPLRVRMGLHSGDAQLSGDDYLGLEVHRAARVAATGHGGQLVISDATRMLLGDRVPPGVRLRDLGEHRLKDLALPEHLWQVDPDGLPAEFPPLRTLDRMPNNLPPQLTSFVGRAEVAAAKALLERTRLLTLTGPGGTGKTRLSLAVAADCLDPFPGGAWFVPLAPVTDPELVASAIAGSVGLLAPDRPPLDRVTEYFRDRTALLVLDNFEQVVGAAGLVGDLLRAAPGLTIITSSRAPLRIAGEQEFPVPPLSLPAAGEARLDALLASEAVRLFVERAMAVRPEFALTADNGSHVAEIVRRLDGLPLAIELAAARIRLLSPSAMVARLNDRLGLLASGGRDRPDRQRTLRGAIEWSHDLLTPEERRVFARLAVFAGGGGLAEAEAVCGADAAGVADLDVLVAIEALAEQSLLRVAADQRGETRFTMLETIQEYALERLTATGEEESLRDRHGRIYLEVAEAASPLLHGDDRRSVLDRLEDDLDNLRAALAHAIDRGETVQASALLTALFRFWHMRGHLVEARARAAVVLAMPGWGDEPSVARLRALETAGSLAYWAGDLGPTSRYYEEAEIEARRLGDEREIANALYNRFFSGRPTSGLLDWISTLAGENRAFLDEALAIFRRLDDELGIARCLWALGESSMYRKDADAAEREATEALALFERHGDGFGAAWAHFTRAIARQIVADVPGSALDFAASLRAFRDAGDISGMALVMNAFASLLLTSGHEADAYRTEGVVARWIAETGTHLAALVPDDWFPAPDPQSPDPALRAAWEEGEQMDRDVALEASLDLADALAAGPPGPS